MPIYEYRCQQCCQEFEAFIRSISQTKKVKCSHCGSAKVEKLISSFAFSGSNDLSGSAKNKTGSSSCHSCSGSNCSSCK